MYVTAADAYKKKSTYFADPLGVDAAGIDAAGIDGPGVEGVPEFEGAPDAGGGAGRDGSLIAGQP
jgi:hypothetical protein